MTTQPSEPLSCTGSEKVSGGNSAEDWQREEGGRMKKTRIWEGVTEFTQQKQEQRANELQKG